MIDMYPCLFLVQIGETKAKGLIGVKENVLDISAGPKCAISRKADQTRRW